MEARYYYQAGWNMNFITSRPLLKGAFLLLDPPRHSGLTGRPQRE